MSLSIRRWFHRQKSCSNGYTLIEVLVAMAIFTSMVMLATMALNQGLKQYHGLMEREINFWDSAKKLWINRSFSSAVDYYIYTDAGGWFPYFRGSQDVISYISLAPLVGDLPVSVWLKNERQDNGKRSLVYYELPVHTMTYKEIERAYIFSDYKEGQSIRLLEDVEGIEFKFYGYDLQRRQHAWSGDFDGSRKRVLPTLIKISYTNAGEKNTLIFAIKTDSMIKAIYNEMHLRQ